MDTVEECTLLSVTIRITQCLDMCNKLPLVFVSPRIVISSSTLNSIKVVIASQNGENHETKKYFVS